uniref:Right handed beta helix domain-containing protein n=1 Tax=Tetradesmus obliquus TaxID=3088 RepID=A0A383VHJ5_TETOB|eukprot:jgi/Sobl393_1/468/SZX64671.1
MPPVAHLVLQQPASADDAAASAAAAAAAALPAGPPAARLLATTWNPPTPPQPSLPCRKTAVDTTGFITLWVDAAAKGEELGTRSAPYHSMGPAVAAIPKAVKLTRGIVINVMPGIVYLSRDKALWFESLWGTPSAPIVLQRAPGTAGEADLQGIEVFDCTWLYFVGVTFRQPNDSYGGGDVVHVAHSAYIHLLGISAIGQSVDDMKPQETIKVNQVQGMYIEDSDVSHAGDNGVDFVAVQYGHVCRTKIHEANWCIYAKGGSAYLLIDSNSVYNCNEAGLRIGQGTGFEYMVAPWLQYEAYGIRVTNNLVYNTWGAGLGVAGGYNILVAYNTVFRCGERSHMVEFDYGSRSCDGDTDLDGMCNGNANAGGWGPRRPGMPAMPIPNKAVHFINNLLVNPDGYSASAFFNAPLPHPVGETDTPGPRPPTNPYVSNGLRIRGNVFINEVPDDSLGLPACFAINVACNPAQVRRDNTFNDPALSLDLSGVTAAGAAVPPGSKAALRRAWRRVSVPPPFPTWSTPGCPTPNGTLSNVVRFDRFGVVRNASNDLPGAQL